MGTECVIQVGEGKSPFFKPQCLVSSSHDMVGDYTSALVVHVHNMRGTTDVYAGVRNTSPWSGNFNFKNEDCGAVSALPMNRAALNLGGGMVKPTAGGDSKWVGFPTTVGIQGTSKLKAEVAFGVYMDLFDLEKDRTAGEWATNRRNEYHSGYVVTNVDASETTGVSVYKPAQSMLAEHSSKGLVFSLKKVTKTSCERCHQDFMREVNPGAVSEVSQRWIIAFMSAQSSFVILS